MKRIYEGEAGVIAGTILGIIWGFSYIGGAWDGSGFDKGMLHEILPFLVVLFIGLIIFPTTVGYFVGAIVLETPIAFVVAWVGNGFIYSLKILLIGIIALVIGALITIVRGNSVKWK